MFYIFIYLLLLMYNACLLLMNPYETAITHKTNFLQLTTWNQMEKPEIREVDGFSILPRFSSSIFINF